LQGDLHDFDPHPRVTRAACTGSIVFSAITELKASPESSGCKTLVRLMPAFAMGNVRVGVR
jgi:hypothetical protein